MQLKRFKIIIGGLHCEVPNPKRIMQIDLEDTDETFSNLDMFVVFHEILCKMKKNIRLHDSVRHLELFERYHFGKNENSPLEEINIVASGVFSKTSHPERNILFEAKYSDGRVIDSAVVGVILFEILCNIRNHMADDMSREDIAKFAKEFEIYEFGMRSEERPFKTRGANDGVQKFIK